MLRECGVYIDVKRVLRLSSENASGCSNSDPGDGQGTQKVAEFAESEHCTAEYQAQCSADITQQSQCRVGLLGLDERVLQLREKHLARSQKLTSSTNRH